MSERDNPEPGLIISYFYLWHTEFVGGNAGRGRLAMTAMASTSELIAILVNQIQPCFNPSNALLKLGKPAC